MKKNKFLTLLSFLFVRSNIDLRIIFKKIQNKLIFSSQQEGGVLLKMVKSLLLMGSGAGVGASEKNPEQVKNGPAPQDC